VHRARSGSWGTQLVRASGLGASFKCFIQEVVLALSQCDGHHKLLRIYDSLVDRPWLLMLSHKSSVPPNWIRVAFSVLALSAGLTTNTCANSGHAKTDTW
jgi:hypothetical protein